jgi:type VI secretion system secreted protein Hcp
MYLEYHKDGKAIKGFTGEKDTTFDGKPCMDLTRVQAFNHALDVETDPQTGEPTATVMHRPVMLTINFDRAVPELYEAFTKSLRLNAKLYFFRSGHTIRSGGHSDAKYHNFFSITLDDVRVTSIHLRKSLVLSEGQAQPDLVDVTFRYYEIRWEDHEDDKEAHSSWAHKAG